MGASVDRLFTRLGIMKTKGFKTRIIMKSKNTPDVVGTVVDFLYDEDATKVIIQEENGSQTTLYINKMQEVNREMD